jgi:hypothetical protein
VLLHVGSKPVTALALEAANEEDVGLIETSWKRLVQFGIATGRQHFENEARREEGPVAQATVAYIQRLTVEIERQLTFARNGNRLVLRVEANQQHLAQTGVMVGLLLPAVQAAREAARRVQSSNNLKQIMLAAHNYLSANRTFPSGGQPSAQSKSKLSWRVQLLPYIEQAQLYNEFHHDEAWDSEHNIKLLERMPATYRHPQSQAAPGMTVYQMSVGENLAGEDGKSLKFQDFTDGTSNTIFVVETIDEAAVPWTKPQDVNPLTNPEKLRITNGIFQAAFTDGSVRSVSEETDPDTLKAMLTRNQGEILRQ